MTKKELKSAQEKLEMLRNGKAATEKMNDAECLELYGIFKAQVLKNLSSAITRTEQDIYRAEHPLTGIDRKLVQIASKHLIHQIAGRKKKRFCSVSCCQLWWNAHPDAVRQKALYHYTCAGCGKAFTAYGNSHRKYCSHECYIKDRYKENDAL